MTGPRSIIAGTGSYLPAKILTNHDLAAMVDTTHEWIVERSGIHARHIAADGETTSDMAIAACKKAMEAAGVHGADIDGVIVATTTPDRVFPAVAVRVQDALGVKTGPSFDVQAVCSGFIYALSVADALLRTGPYERFLVVGAEKFSSIVDWTDRGTCVLFGDGAGAVVLEKSTDAGGRGVLSTHLHADGQYQDILYADGGPSSTGTVGKTVMHGKEVFKNAVVYLADVVEEVLAHHGITAGQIDWLVPHQANSRIIEGTARKLGLPMDRVVMTVAGHGNTSAASIPLALDTGVRDGRLKPGQLLLLEALGGGLTWGAALVRL